MTVDFRSAPLDEQAATVLADRGLELRIVDPSDRDAMERYVQSAGRGFLGPAAVEPSLSAQIAEYGAHRRCCAVYDPAGPDPLTPIATINSWIGPLTLPGERQIDAWAISGVTVTPTHRRRGIQRQLMEAELRTATRLGVPVSMLTVSESQIYGRYGYGCAVLAGRYRIDTRALSWIGPLPDGRVDFIPVARWRELAPVLAERLRLRDPGQVATFDHRWNQIAGSMSSEGDQSAKRRAVQYTDAAGEVRGLAIYQVGDDHHGEFEGATVAVDKVFAETDDAYAALWRFLLELDLVATVTYDLGSTDEPLRWMVSDFRAVTVETYDMHYLRVLDVAAAVGELPVSIEVADPLGFATGRYGPGSGEADVQLDVVALSSLLVGGVAASTLVTAGRIRERTPDAAAALGQALRSDRIPKISFWY